MVEIVDPKKTEKVLDPACGTAGFLISSYKHILKANVDANANSILTPDDKGRLAQDFKGYDISPDMVRLSLVNMYLHGFTDLHIYEYDTLTSVERWNEFADVILANPPFMSPKGGIKPHKRFSIQAKRCEVLFVDYMAEHLTPTGRAGIIVPEGIIFQSQDAYRVLRKMLVENSLVAVVSLPAGCFNPYSGVKTSILILDKSLARHGDTIAFFKIENDGFGLGAQRRAFDKNDIPQVKAELHVYLRALRSRRPSAEPQPTFGLIVPKEKIAANGDYNLSGERYRESAASNHSFPLVSLGETNLFCVEGGGTPKSGVEEYWGGGIPWATLVDLPATNFITEITRTKRTISEQGLRESSAKIIPANSVIVSTRATIGRIAINRVPIATNQGFKNVIIEDSARAIPEYVALALTKLVPTMEAWATGGTFAEISKSKFCELQIPLPPLDMQREIAGEIAGYQGVIDGARTVLDNYRPHIPIHPDWPIVRLADVCETVTDGDHQPPPKATEGVPFVTITNITDDHQLDFTKTFFVPESYYDNLSETKKPRPGDILYTVTGSYGIPVLVGENARFCFQRHIALIRTGPQLLNTFLHSLLASPFMLQQGDAAATGVAQKTVSLSSLRDFTVPLPPLATQQAIVAEIETDQVLVAANRELISRFEKKIQATLARVWGEEETVATEAWGMEEAAELANYLPLSFKTATEQEYIEFLWDAFDTNYRHGKYQFAFLAYHMLTMSFIYFNIWQIKQTEPKDFAMGLIGFGKDIEKSLLEANSPFVFSTVNERSILRFLKLIACDNSKIGTYAKLVDDRNETAHPNGNIFFSTEAALDVKITEILRVVGEIQSYSKPVIDHCYREFLIQNNDPDEREYPDHEDQIREVLIHGNYLSQRDIEICLDFDIGNFAAHPGYKNMCELHDGLVARWGKPII
jgi:type I restriction enzyme M protein